MMALQGTLISKVRVVARLATRVLDLAVLLLPERIPLVTPPVIPPVVVVHLVEDLQGRTVITHTDHDLPHQAGRLATVTKATKASQQVKCSAIVCPIPIGGDV
jgi:hypothetical protein